MRRSLAEEQIVRLILDEDGRACSSSSRKAASRSSLLVALGVCADERRRSLLADARAWAVRARRP